MKVKIRSILRFLLWLVALPLLAAVLALSVYDIRLPQFVTDAVCAKFSSKDALVRCDWSSFGFRHGLTIDSARIYARDKVTTAPVLKADRIEASLALYRFPWRMERLLRRVKITGLKYLRLPDGYYIADSVEFPGQPDYLERTEPVSLDLPVLHPFKLELVEPDILGIRPSLVEIAAVSCGKSGFKARGITIEWPDRDVKMHLTGETELNLVSQTVTGRITGNTRQWHIRPLVETLDIPIALEYIDAFTDVREPVDASCSFSADIRANGIHMTLDLAPKAGRYRGIPYSSARGTIQIDSAVSGTNLNSSVVIGPIVADFLPDGHAEGSLVFTSSNGVRRMAIDANSARLSMSNALTIAETFTDGTLDDLQMETPPLISIKGVLDTDGTSMDANRLRGEFAFERGTLFGVPLRNAHVRFRQEGSTIFYDSAAASMKSGGRIDATARMDFPNDDSAKPAFSLKARGNGLSLGDLSEAFKTDSGDKKGIVECNLELAGPLSEDFLRNLNGKGSFKCHDGQLSRMKLFMGFTDYLSDKVPGVSSVVDMTQSSGEFDISNGVISTKEVLVEGNIFAMKASGSYDMAADMLEARARAQMFRKDSIIGLLTQPITSALMKMLLEFRVYGPIADPKWTYSTPVTRGLGGGK